MELHICLLWHTVEHKITQAKLVPKHSATWLVSMWGQNAQSTEVIHNLKEEDLENHVVALIYGKYRNVKVRLFKTYAHAQMAVNVLLRVNDLEIVTGFEF